MADERQTPDTDEELLLEDELEPGDDDDQRTGDEDADPNLNDEGDEEEVLSFGDDGEGQEGDSGLVKHLRTELKKRGERISELERSVPRQETIEVGDKPTLAGCDYDEDKYEGELEAWQDRKRRKDAQQGQSQEAEDAERESWQAELDRVNREKAELGADDAEDAFDTVRASLNTVQQAVLVKATDNTARLIYALSKHPDKLAELAAIQDPLKLAAKVAKLEGQLRVVKRRRAPDPEQIERGSGRVSHQSNNKQRDKLAKEADRTGDRTELIRFDKAQRQKATAK